VHQHRFVGCVADNEIFIIPKHVSFTTSAIDFCPGNEIVEWWIDEIFVFKMIVVILILSSILPAMGTLIQHCIILSKAPGLAVNAPLSIF